MQIVVNREGLNTPERLYTYYPEQIYLSRDKDKVHSATNMPKK
jgi:hypothetical protein